MRFDARALVQLHSMCSGSVISFGVVALELMTGDGTAIWERRAASLPAPGAHARGINETGQCVCLILWLMNWQRIRVMFYAHYQVPIVLPGKAK